MRIDSRCNRHFFPPSKLSPGGKKCLGHSFPRGKKLPDFRHFFPPGERIRDGEKSACKGVHIWPLFSPRGYNCLISHLFPSEVKSGLQEHIKERSLFPPLSFSPGGKVTKKSGNNFPRGKKSTGWRHTNHEQKMFFNQMFINPVYPFIAGLKNVKLFPSLLSRW